MRRRNFIGGVVASLVAPAVPAASSIALPASVVFGTGLMRFATAPGIVTEFQFREFPAHSVTRVWKDGALVWDARRGRITSPTCRARLGGC